MKIRDVLQEFEEGEFVYIDIEPASQKGMPHLRFQGRGGKVLGKRGRAFLIKVRDGGKYKTIISAPEHLKPNK